MSASVSNANPDNVLVAKSLVVARKLAGGKNVSSGIYGTIITIAVIGAWYADPTSGAFETLLSVLATLIVFWIAHVYSHVATSGLTRTDILHAFQQDWPIVQTGLLPLIVLGFGSLDLFAERSSLLLAIAVGGVLLAFFCFTTARGNGRSRVQSLGLAIIMLIFGMFIAVLEIKLG